MNKSRQEIIEEIAALEGYSYKLWSYEYSHSHLTVLGEKVLDGQRAICALIRFGAVAYIRMPRFFGYAHFRTGTEEELEAAISEVINPSRHTLQVGYQLFIFEGPNVKAWILSSLIGIEYKCPWHSDQVEETM